MYFSDKTTKYAARYMPCISAFLFISLIFGNNLWMDEAFSAVLVKGSFGEMLQRSFSDTLPPLYNILNWSFVQLFGYAPWALRLGSCLPMLLLLALSATVIKKRFGDMVSLIFTLCISGMPWIFYYSTEIRMYALGMCFATAAGIFAIELCKSGFSKMSGPALILSAIGAGYTHHFAFVAALFIYLYLLLYAIRRAVMERSVLIKEVKAVAAIILITALCYLPCLFITLKQMGRVRGYFSMPDADLSSLIACLKQPFITELTPLSALLILIFVLTLAAGLFYSDKERRAYILLAGMTYPLVMLFGFAANRVLSSNIFSQRYLIPSLGLLWLGFSIAAGKVTEKVRPLSIILPLCLLAVVINDYYLRYKAEYDSRADEMITYFEGNVAEDDGYIIYEDDYQLQICFRYYFPSLKCLSWDDADSAKALWYIEVPGFEDKKEEITAHGYEAQRAGDFAFDRYSFTLYRLTR